MVDIVQIFKGIHIFILQSNWKFTTAIYARKSWIANLKWKGTFRDTEV